MGGQLLIHYDETARTRWIYNWRNGGVGCRRTSRHDDRIHAQHRRNGRRSLRGPACSTLARKLNALRRRPSSLARPTRATPLPSLQRVAVTPPPLRSDRSTPPNLEARRTRDGG